MNFLAYLLGGISLGSIYALIALGYTMVYGIAKMLNFAHGDIIMVGGYVVFFAMSSSWCPTWLAIVFGIAACTVLGVVIEKIAYKPLRSMPSLTVLITAIGVSYFLQNAALLLFKSNTRTFKSVTENLPDLNLGGLVITSETIVTISVTVVLMIALTLFVNKTKMGKAMRAVSEDKEAAELMGISVNKTITLTFAIGSALAAVAGVLLCSNFHALSPYKGVCGGCFRRNRKHSRRHGRRHTARSNREPFKGIYLHSAFRRDSLSCADTRASREADGYFRQESKQKGLRRAIEWKNSNAQQGEISRLLPV